MVGLRAVIILVVLMPLILSVVGHKDRRSHARHARGFHREHRTMCTNDPSLYQFFPPCSTSTTTSSTTTAAGDSSEETVDTTTTEIANTTTEPTSLERAHWCRFGNGTYLPLGYSYMHTVCQLCQCTKSRIIRCQLLQCMPTYCVDNSMPVRKAGQCCTTCGYEIPTNSCVYNGISYPHGAIMKLVENKMQCWCQLGNIECRDYIGTLLESMSVMAEGVTIYIIVAVIFVVLIFGVLLCCSCTILIYYYYNKNQCTFQQAYEQYEQYANSAGWQPVEEGEENAVDDNAEEKRIEAEKSEFSNSVDDAVPPPYAAYNSSYVSEEEQK